MGRSKWKGPYTNESLLKKNSSFKSLSRGSDILPQHIGKTITLYNGEKFKDVLIIDDMLSYKIGEFFFTRKKFSFKKKKKQKK